MAAADRRGVQRLEWWRHRGPRLSLDIRTAESARKLLERVQTAATATTTPTRLVRAQIRSRQGRGRQGRGVGGDEGDEGDEGDAVPVGPVSSPSGLFEHLRAGVDSGDRAGRSEPHSH